MGGRGTRYEMYGVRCYGNCDDNWGTKQWNAVVMNMDRVGGKGREEKMGYRK